MKKDYPVRHPAYIVENLSDANAKFIGWQRSEFDYAAIQNITMGEGAKMAVIDNGVDENHSQLKGRVKKYVDVTGEDGIPGDHGTHVGGIGAASLLGLFPRMEIGDFKALNSQGSGTTSWVTQQIVNAKSEGYQVINMSLGSQFEDANQRAVIRDFLNDKKCFMVAASGNDGLGTETEFTTDWPAAWSKDMAGLISVAALERRSDGTIAVTTWSSRGYVTISAPGHFIQSLGINDREITLSGTSMASPWIAALIAAAKGIYPRFNQDDFHLIASGTSDDISRPGQDNVSGYGIVDAVEFLRRVQEMADEDPVIEEDICGIVTPEEKEILEVVRKYPNRLTLRNITAVTCLPDNYFNAFWRYFETRFPKANRVLESKNFERWHMKRLFKKRNINF